MGFPFSRFWSVLAFGKARLHGGISHGTYHGISHGTQLVPEKVGGTSRVNGGLAVGPTEYHGISHRVIGS
jgi:hypothetical protein